MTMNKMLFILLLTIIAFVVTVIVFNAQGLLVQDSLINMFLGAAAAELVAMGGIKMFKVKHTNKEDSDEH